LYALTVGIVVGTKQIWDELSRAAEELSLRTVFELSELPPDWSGFLDRIERLRPDIVLLDLATLREPLETAVSRIRSTSAAPAVFALQLEANPEAILTALRAGASEYLYPPLMAGLKSAVERVGREREKVREARTSSGKSLAFVSAKGGCGATTLACHIAVDLPRLTNSRVLLADLDLQAGLIGFLIKSKSPYSIADAAANLQRLDSSYWRGIISNGIPNLEIVSAPVGPSGKQVLPQQLKQVVAFAKAQYSWSIFDLGRNVTASTLNLLDLMDETYLVTTHEIPALHQAKQMIQLLLDAGYAKENLRVILNRAPKHSDVTTEELESMLGTPIFATVANDYQSLQDAFSEGRLADSSTPFGRSASRLGSKIAGVKETKKKFSLFG
jgi:pilus assembly protein CpaE